MKKNLLGTKTNTILKCENLRKAYGEFLVLDKLSFSLKRGERMGVVGPNGSGKSTLLKILAGLDRDYEGKVHASGTVKYVPQEITEAERAMTVLEFLQKENKENVQNIAASFLDKLDVPAVVFEKKVGELSGGEQSKVAMARILIAPHDILLLDEPTNNLDFKALEFLEEMIKKSKKAFLIISHDRKFLDNSVSKILELDEFERSARVYDGTFTEYMDERKARVEKEWSAYGEALRKSKKLASAAEKHVRSVGAIEKTLKDKRKMSSKITDKDHLKKGMIGERAGKIGRQAKVLKNRLEKMDAEALEKPKRKLPIKLVLEPSERSGTKVLTLSSVEKQMGNTKIGPIDLELHYGDRALITGANGAGKSTLVRMILGQIEKDAGEIKIGERVCFGYLAQDTNFESDETLREKLLAVSGKEEGDLRKILNRFGLAEEDMKKKLSDLSPGERSRVILALLTVQSANCLVLDEPSNHLDLEALEALEDALKTYTGTFIVVSHDREFIDKINPSKSYELKDGKLLNDAGY